MARRVQTTASRITEIETKRTLYQSKIDSYKAKISDLDAKIQELKEIQKHKDLETLFEYIKAAGKTPGDVIAALNADKSDSQ